MTITESKKLETISIVSTPGMLGGKPHLEGRRISVQHIAEHYSAGWPLEEISEAFKLSMGEIHAALSYYYEHKDEIDATIRDEQAEVEHILAAQRAFAGTDDLLQAVMSASAVAATYDLSPRTVRDAIEQGKIEAIKSAGIWLVRRADAEARWGHRRK